MAVRGISGLGKKPKALHRQLFTKSPYGYPVFLWWSAFVRKKSFLFISPLLLISSGLYSAPLFAQDEPKEATEETIQQIASSDVPVADSVVGSEQTQPEIKDEKDKFSFNSDQNIEKPSSAAVESYSTKTFANDMKAIKWDAIGAFAGITALGVKSWKWGNSDFHFHNEKWFQKDRSSIGMDKLGHAFTSYTMTNLFAEHLQREGRSPEQAAISAALLTQALMLYVETFDGFSTDHGFSYEDVVMNLAGTSLAYVRQRYPKIKDLVDYRMEYSPSGYKGDGMKGFRPVSDYAGQKYLLVLKLSGVPSLKDTPLKYLELNAGYYARGFTPQEEALGTRRTRTGFVGIGLNLSQLFFGNRAPNESLPKTAGRDLFEHIQLPTYVTPYKKKF